MPEPVSLSEAKRQLRMENDDSEDTFIETDLIPQVRAIVERRTGLSFVAATRTATFNRWGDYLEIYKRPIASVTSPIVYTDSEGDDEAEYTGFLVSIGDTTRIYPAVDGEFPDIATGGKITVTYETGALSDTSEEYLAGKRAMLLLLGIMFENRGEIPLSKDQKFAVDAVLADLTPLSAY